MLSGFDGLRFTHWQAEIRDDGFVLVGLTWLLLWLWAALFQLVDIGFFRTLFRDDAFIALATGTLFGFGVLIGRTQHRAIQTVRSVLFAVGRGLLPLLAFIALLFVLSLPFTGLEPLWRTRSAARVASVTSSQIPTASTGRPRSSRSRRASSSTQW